MLAGRNVEHSRSHGDTGHLDRSMNMPIGGGGRRLGGPAPDRSGAFASPLIPATRSDEAVAQGATRPSAARSPSSSSPAPTGPRDAASWTPARARWPPHAPGVVGTHAPGPATLTRDGLRHTLNLMRDLPRSRQQKPAGLAKRHRAGARLGPPNLLRDSLPEDLRWFLSTIAGSGAGPGYTGWTSTRPTTGIHLADASLRLRRSGA